MEIWLEQMGWFIRNLVYGGFTVVWGIFFLFKGSIYPAKAIQIDFYFIVNVILENQEALSAYLC